MDGSKIGPLTLADTLQKNGEDALALVEPLTGGSPTLHCEIADVKAWAYYSLYFSKKLRAAVLLQSYISNNKKNEADKTNAIALLKGAKADWANLVAVTKPHYLTIPVTALHRRLFSWDNRSAAVDKDIVIAEGM